MPTRPQEDSPFVASLLQREMGPRQPGSPSVAGKPTPQAGGLQFPAPPGVNTGQVGRPPEASGPAPSPAPSAGIAPRQPGGMVPTAPVPGQPPQVDPALLMAKESMRVRQALGPMPKVFTDTPGMPQLPVMPGRWNFNPFTGSWSK